MERLSTRYLAHLNAFAAEWLEATDLSTDAPGSPEQEPYPLLPIDEHAFYSAWLRHQGHISEQEYTFLLGAVARARRMLADE